MANLVDQIKAYNQALQNKTWQGDWQGGGEGAINEAAKQLENLGVTNIQKLKVEKNIERLPVATLYNGQPIQTDPVTGKKFYNAQENIGGFTDNWEYATVRKYIPSNAPLTYAKLVDVQVGTGDNIDYVSQLVPLTAEEKSTYDPVTSTYGKLAGNKLVDTSTNKTIATSSNNNFIINKYDTGNFFKGKDKSFGFIANDQGEVVPYQTSEKSGLVNSPVFPAIMAMIAPGVGGLLGTATGLTGSALNIATGATLGAGSAALTDQDILRGALTGAVGAGASSLVAPAISNSLGGGQFGNIAAGALTGGGIAELTGGDFLQGAVRGGVSAGISDYQQQLRQESFDTAMTESGLAGQTSVDGFQPPAAVISEPTIQDVISQITAPTQEQFQPSIDQLFTELSPYSFSSDIASSSFVGPRQEFEQTNIPLEFQVQPSSIDELLTKLARAEVLPEEISSPVTEQTVLTQEQAQPVINELIAKFAPYEVPPEIILPTQVEQTVPTQEQTQPSIDQLITQLAPFELSFVSPSADSSFVGPRQEVTVQPDFQVAPPSIDQLLVELASPEAISPPIVDQTVLTQEQLQPSIDELITQLAPYEVFPEVTLPTQIEQTVPTQEQLQTSIDELIAELAPYEAIPEITITAPREQTVPTQEEMQPVIDDLIAELAPYEVPPTQEIVVTAPRDQTVPTQEEMQPSIDELLTELAPYEVPEIPEIVITAPREQTVLTQEQMQPEIDELLAELAPYKVIPEIIDTSGGVQTVPTQEEAQLSIDELLTELASYEVPAYEVMAEPDVQPAPVDNSGLIAALDVLKVISPAVITALLADNSTDTTTETPEQTGFPILPIPGDWRSPTYNQAFTPSAPIDFGTSALLAGTQWENPQQFEPEQPYNLSNLINTLNYQSVPFVQQQMPQQIFNVNDVASQYRTTPTVGARDIIGNLGGKPVSIADIISGIQSQYG